MRLGVIAAAASIALIAGCGSGSDAHKTPSSADNQLAYIATIRGHLGGLSEYSDKQLTDIGHSECEMLATGSTQSDVVDTMANTSATKYDRADLAYWVGAAHSAYCPDA